MRLPIVTNEKGKTMHYEPLLNTPLANAGKAAFDLRIALYDLASIFSANEDFQRSGKMVALRDVLRAIELEIQSIDKLHNEALDRELSDQGII